MSDRRARDGSVGVVLSLIAHVGVLLVAGAWLDRERNLLPEEALAVAIWTQPVPPVEPEPPAEDVSARTVEAATPAPAEVQAEELEPEDEALPVESEELAEAPEPDPVEDVEESEPVAAVDTKPEPIVIPEPPPETERPELPEMGMPEIEIEAEVPPLAGVLEMPPSGPAEADRGRIIGERLSASARRANERVSRLSSQSRPREVAGLEREADTLMVPAGDTPLASDKGVVGPLGQRHILYSEPPAYPAWARRMGLEAEVRFRIWVTPEGTVSRVDVLERSGSTELDRLAEDALRRWRFQPLPRTETARDEWGEVPMTFTLVAD